MSTCYIIIWPKRQWIEVRLKFVKIFSLHEIGCTHLSLRVTQDVLRFLGEMCNRKNEKVIWRAEFDGILPIEHATCMSRSDSLLEFWNVQLLIIGGYLVYNGGDLVWAHLILQDRPLVTFYLHIYNDKLSQRKSQDENYCLRGSHTTKEMSL